MTLLPCCQEVFWTFLKNLMVNRGAAKCGIIFLWTVSILLSLAEVVLGLVVYGVMFTALQFLIPGGIIGSTLDTSTSSCPVQSESGSGSQGSQNNNKQGNNGQSSSGQSNSEQSNTGQGSGSQSNNQKNQPTVHYDKKSNVVAKGSNGMSYILHVPEGATNNMPLVVFMHGQGETNSVNAVKNTPAVKAMDNATAYPASNSFIAISPVQPDDAFSAAKVFTRTKALIDEVAEAYQVDKSRIYIIGFSMGAAHTWCMVNQYPGLFSAAVPVSLSPKYDCAGSGPTASNFKNTKVWAMCGGSEDYAKKTQSFVNEINDAGGSAKFSKVGNANHSQVQGQLNYSDIFSWLLAN